MLVIRMSIMGFPAGIMVATVALAGCLFAQDSLSPSSSANPSAVSTVSMAAPPIELKPDSTGVVPPEQIRELLRRAEDKDLENDKLQRNYTYVEREERHHLDSRGAVQKVESRTLEVLQIYGEDVERLTEKDDKPLPADEARKKTRKSKRLSINVRTSRKTIAESALKKKKSHGRKTASSCSKLPTHSTFA